jgi:hypothetical protein
MRTTLAIDDRIAARLKAYSRKHGLSFKDTVNELLRQGLDAPQMLKVAVPFRVEARALQARPGVKLDNIAELLEVLDGAGHR